jgi:hypothetical protein
MKADPRQATSLDYTNIAEIWEKTAEIWEKTAEIWEITAEIWEKFKYKNCGNLGKKSISKVRKYGKKMRKYGNLRLFICGILATYRFFSICGNMGKCCGIVVFSPRFEKNSICFAHNSKIFQQSNFFYIIKIPLIRVVFKGPNHLDLVDVIAKALFK